MKKQSKDYKKPEVKTLGSVSEVTAGGTGSMMEPGGQGQGNDDPNRFT